MFHPPREGAVPGNRASALETHPVIYFTGSMRNPRRRCGPTGSLHRHGITGGRAVLRFLALQLRSALAGLVVLSIASAVVSPALATTPFVPETVDAVGLVGYYTALALDIQGN